MDDGDCLVYLYSLGASQRGPSLRIRLASCKALRSEYLTEHCLHCRDASSPIGSDDGSSDSGYASSQASKQDTVDPYELYIPAPTSLSRDQAYEYHLTTRNFFAYATSRPVVGEKLGVALADLLARIKEWQPQTTVADFMSYCKKQGYEDMAQNADYAIACLTLADQAKLNDLWVESFVHCVGMHNQLSASPEFDGLSETTKTLITCASSKLDTHMTRAVRALGSFLEDDLGVERLGLSKAARNHLDRFRSRLHSYYVSKLGYFPPDQDKPWNKRLWTDMCYAFQSLYEYLVDSESTIDPTNNRGLTGGICVMQNIQAFDQHHGYTPLPHPLPLLPDLTTRKRADLQTALRGFKRGKLDSSINCEVSPPHALAQATNSQNPDVMACELVQVYQHFERQRLEEKLSVVDARKTRWLLIYGILQTLISITKAPKEVHDTKTPTYPVCVHTTGPPWLRDAARSSQEDPETTLTDTRISSRTIDEEQDRMSIRPDCEADSAEDFFSFHASSRSLSQVDLAMTPASLRITKQISRAVSIHSGVHGSTHPFQNFSSSRSGLRRATSNAQLATGSFCEILIEGYGNGAFYEREAADRQTDVGQQEAEQPGRSNPFAEFDFDLDNVDTEAIHDDSQNHCLASAPMHLCKGPDAFVPALTSGSANPTRSSMYKTEFSTLGPELSPWQDIESRQIGRGTASSISSNLVRTDAPFRLRRNDYQEKAVFCGSQANCFSVNAGCYTPTGLIQPVSKC